MASGSLAPANKGDGVGRESTPALPYYQPSYFWSNRELKVGEKNLHHGYCKRAKGDDNTSSAVKELIFSDAC